MMATSLYETDLYAWSQKQVELIRAEDFAEVDWHHLIEEIDSLGISQLNEVESRLIKLIMHLLKWQYQPEKRQRGRSWYVTITHQRVRLERTLGKTPTLRARLPEIIDDVYPSAVKLAAAETQLPRTTFPAQCPYSPAQILDDEFFPSHEDQ
jgi:hypothetical protein